MLFGLKIEFLRADQDEENEFHLASTIREHLGNPHNVESSLSIAYNLRALSHKMLFDHYLTGSPQHHSHFP